MVAFSPAVTMAEYLSLLSIFLILVGSFSSTIHSSHCPTAVILDAATTNPHWLKLSSKVWSTAWSISIPLLIFSRGKIQQSKPIRTKKLLHKFGENCYTILIPYAATAGAQTNEQFRDSYKQIGFRAKDSFIFFKFGEDSQNFMQSSYLQQQFRYFSIVTEWNEVNFDVLTVLTGSSRELERSRVNFDGAVLRVAAVTSPPNTIIDKKSGGFKGSMIDTFGFAAEKFNFTVSWDMKMFKKGGQGRALPNRTWTGVMGALTREVIDVTFMGHHVARYLVADFTTVLSYSASSFLVKRPDVHVRWTALIDPFSWLVWLGYGLSFVAIVTAVYFTTKVYDNSYHDKAYASIMLPLSLSLDQGAEIPGHSQMIAAFWMFAVIVLSTGYKDKLMAFLTFPELEPIPTSLADFSLPEFSNYRLFQYSWLISFRLNNSKDPNIFALKDRWEYRADGSHCVVSATLEERTACVGYDHFMAVSISKNLTINSRFFAPVRSPQILPGIPVSFGLPKDSPHTADWDVIAGMYRDYGLYNKIREDALLMLQLDGMHELNKRRDSDKVYGKLEQLMLEDGMTVRKLELRNFVTISIVSTALLLVSGILFAMEKNGKFSSKPPAHVMWDEGADNKSQSRHGQSNKRSHLTSSAGSGIVVLDVQIVHDLRGNRNTQTFTYLH